MLVVATVVIVVGAGIVHAIIFFVASRPDASFGVGELNFVFQVLTGNWGSDHPNPHAATSIPFAFWVAVALVINLGPFVFIYQQVRSFAADVERTMRLIDVFRIRDRKIITRFRMGLPEGDRERLTKLLEAAFAQGHEDWKEDLDIKPDHPKGLSEKDRRKVIDAINATQVPI